MDSNATALAQWGDLPNKTQDAYSLGDTRLFYFGYIDMALINVSPAGKPKPEEPVAEEKKEETVPIEEAKSE